MADIARPRVVEGGAEWRRFTKLVRQIRDLIYEKLGYKDVESELEIRRLSRLNKPPAFCINEVRHITFLGIFLRKQRQTLVTIELSARSNGTVDCTVHKFFVLRTVTDEVQNYGEAFQVSTIIRSLETLY